MRKLIIERLEEIRHQNEGRGDTMQWRDFRVFGWTLFQVIFERLDDDELLRTFEQIIHRHYTQM